MRRFGLVLFVALAPSVATAQVLGGIEQRADGSQLVTNTVEVGSLESLTDRYMSDMLHFGSTGNLSQVGSNTINTIVYRGTLGEVIQRFDGIQSVNNALEMGQVDIFGSVTQWGTNIAGSVDADTITYADQLFGADGRQLVLNTAEIAILYGSVGQYGKNVANMANATHAIGTASQVIELGAIQRIDNRLHVAAMSAVAAAVEQRGENFGNTMVTETVDRVTRNFAGDQIIHNVIYLGDNAPASITQSGANVANFIMSSRIGSLSQRSVGRQETVNEVFDAQGGLLTGGNINQSSSDFVNLIVLTQPSEGGNGAIISVEQSAEYPQSSVSSGTASQTGNALSVDR